MVMKKRIAVFSHLSDLQENASSEDKEKINFIKFLLLNENEELDPEEEYQKFLERNEGK